MLPRIHADGDAFSGDGGGVPLRRRGRDGAFGARGAFARAGHGGGGRGARLGQGALFARLRKCRARRVPRRKGRGIHPQSAGGVPCSRPSARAAENGEHLRAAGGGERLSFRPRRSRSGALRRAGIRICDGRRARDQTGRAALFFGASLLGRDGDGRRIRDGLFGRYPAPFLFGARERGEVLGGQRRPRRGSQPLHSGAQRGGARIARTAHPLPHRDRAGRRRGRARRGQGEREGGLSFRRFRRGAGQVPPARRAFAARRRVRLFGRAGGRRH